MAAAVLSSDQTELSWAAGLFVGEGNVGRVRQRLKYEYLVFRIGMYDEVAIRRFAKIFDATCRRTFLKNRNHFIYYVYLRGRPAERALSLIWHQIRSTDKGDQAMRYASQLGVEDWITGETIGRRPPMHRGAAPGASQKGEHDGAASHDQLAWAAGLFVGEGNVGRKCSIKDGREFWYLNLQISMCDRRAIARFAGTFGINYHELSLKKYAGGKIYKVSAGGRPAERILRLLWPHLEGTDKGNQTISYATRLGVDPWVTGTEGGIRPQLKRARRGGNGGRPKLTDDQVRYLRVAGDLGNVNFISAAREFGVSERTVRYVVRRKSYLHVTEVLP